MRGSSAEPERPNAPEGWTIEPGVDPAVETRVSPDGSFRLRDLVETRPPGDARSLALAFLRPQDPAFEDRVLDHADDGRWIAFARARPVGAGGAVRYLWFAVLDLGDRLHVAARVVELPLVLDGGDEAAEILRLADAAMRVGSTDRRDETRLVNSDHIPES